MNARNPVAVLAANALVAVLVLAGCGATRPQTTTSTATRGSAPAGTRTVSTIDGPTLRLPDGKPAALFFFTVGCGSG
jgi:hypothetical protein